MEAPQNDDHIRRRRDEGETIDTNPARSDHRAGSLCGRAGVHASADQLRTATGKPPTATGDHVRRQSVARHYVNLHDTKLPTDWSIEKVKEKNVLWSFPLGTKAYGGPVVIGGRIFIGTNNGRPRDPKIVGDKGVMMCFDEKTAARPAGEDIHSIHAVGVRDLAEGDHRHQRDRSIQHHVAMSW